jgi:hypothetical protein
MSLETDVAALVALINPTLALPQALYNEGIAAVGRVTAAYTAAAKVMVTIFVDPVNGIDADARSGSAAQPLLTLQAAIARVPIGGIGRINLTGSITIQTTVTIAGRTIFLFSTTATRHAIQFQRTSPNGVNRSLAAFGFEAGGQLALFGLTLIVPDTTAFSGFAQWAASAVFQVPNDALTTMPFVQLVACDISLPAAIFGPLISSARPLGLFVSTCVLTGSPLTGRVIASQANTATPVATTTYPWLLTNLTEV